MKEINIKGMYPHITKDCFVPLSAKQRNALQKLDRKVKSQERKKYRYKAQFSLDCNDGIETEAVCHVPSPEELYLQKERNLEIHKALHRLPWKMRERIYAHFFFDMTVDEIAQREGVKPTCVRKSIDRGLDLLKKDTTFQRFPSTMAAGRQEYNPVDYICVLRRTHEKQHLALLR